MNATLPTWWVIQLVCRISFDEAGQPEPFHRLDCAFNTATDNRTTAGPPPDGGYPPQRSFAGDQLHRLYYRCLFRQARRHRHDDDEDEYGGMHVRSRATLISRSAGSDSDEEEADSQLADCRSTEPPLPLLANDTDSFDLEQEFPRRVSLKVLNLTTTATPPTIHPADGQRTVSTPAVWLTLPRFPHFNDSLFRDVRLRCQRHLDEAAASVLCELETDRWARHDSFWRRYEMKIFFVVAVIAAIAAGGIGNILVCLAVCLDRRLQNVTNYFLLSLAIADLLVSLFVMPLGAIQGFFGYWPLGIVWCNVYVSCDVLACSCSIMHMCSISWGRYLGIRNPLKTRHAYSTKRIVGIKIAVVWALSLVVSTSVTLLGLYDSKNIMPEPNNCVINNSTFFVLGSVVAFYIPMLIMMVTYVLTVQLLRKKARFLQQKPGNGHEPQTFRRLGGRFRKPPSSSDSSSTQLASADSTRTVPKRSLSTPHKWKTKITTRSLNKNAPPTISSSQPMLIGPGARAGAASSNGAQRPGEMESVRMIGECQTEIPTSRNSRIRTLRLPLNVTPSNLNLRFLPSRNKRQNVTTVTNAVRTEQKASKVLGLVFFSFVLCWTPFFLLNIVFAVCPRSHCRIPTYLVEGALWLGYASSIINPIIYTIFNRTFRAAFVRLLQCKCQRLSRPPRYRSVNENRNSALLAQTPSSAAAAGVATVPLSLSLQGTPLVTPSSASSYLTNVRTPVMQHSESFEIAESSTTT